MMGYNVHFPNTEPSNEAPFAREFHLLINGKSGVNDLIVTGQRCWDTCLDLLDNNLISDE